MFVSDTMRVRHVECDFQKLQEPSNPLEHTAHTPRDHGCVTSCLAFHVEKREDDGGPRAVPRICGNSSSRGNRGGVGKLVGPGPVSILPIFGDKKQPIYLITQTPTNAFTPGHGSPAWCAKHEVLHNLLKCGQHRRAGGAWTPRRRGVSRACLADAAWLAMEPRLGNMDQQ